MSLTKLEADLKIISKLDDEPNDTQGLTAAELKAKFDEAGETIAEFIDETLIPELEKELEELRGDDDGLQGMVESLDPEGAVADAGGIEAFVEDALSEHDTDTGAHADILKKISDAEAAFSEAIGGLAQKTEGDLTAHNNSDDAHSDIRQSVSALDERVDEEVAALDSKIDERRDEIRALEEDVGDLRDKKLGKTGGTIDGSLEVTGDASIEGEVTANTVYAETVTGLNKAVGPADAVPLSQMEKELEKKFNKAGGNIEGDVVIGDGSLIEDMAGNMEERKVVLHYGKTMLGFANSSLVDVTGFLDYGYGGGKIKGLENAEADDEAVPFGQMKEYVAANGGGGNVAYAATPLVTETATDPDGNAYTGATEYEVTIPNADELFVGMQITVVPTMKSATDKPFITVNGARGRIYTNAATTGAFFNGTRVDFIGANKPLALMYMGIVDETSGMGGWKCLNSVRVNVEALMSNGEAGVNKIPMSNGAGEKLVWRTHKDANLVGDATYNSSANRYDVTLPAIGNTETGDNGVYKGLEVTIIPNVTNKAYAKLAVNNYDGEASGSQIYLSTGDGTGGFVSPPAGFLKAGMPVKMKYTGSGWRITDTPYPDAAALNGAVGVTNGGTGRETLTSGYYLVGNGTGAVQLKSKSAVLTDIGAASKTELEEVKTSVSEGKALIASAVTDRGVTTAGDATFAQIAENISLIESGELAGDEEEIEVFVTPTKKTQEIVASEGEVLGKVTVEPIPDEYIQPSGTLDITENGEHDVTEYAAVSVNVASGGGDDEMKANFIGVLDGTMANPVLPDGLTKIKEYVFYNNKNLVAPSIPDSVENIGDSAFQTCDNLAISSLPASLTSIGKYAFRGCKKITIDSLPESVTNIADYAFYECTNLAITSLPAGLTAIGNCVFYKCTKISITSLPAGVTKISGDAFYQCGAGIQITSLPESLESIGQSAFYGCGNIAITSIPAGVINIGANAFFYCQKITELTFKGTPNSIGNSAFYGCSKLTTINVPWAEGAVANAPWGATNATINYNYTGG